MSEALTKQLSDNISIILKKSLAADATLADLREKNQAKFSAIFTKEVGFNCSDNTFQPYVGEIADDFLLWQQNQEQQLLINLVKKIEAMFKVLADFEQTYSA